MERWFVVIDGVRKGPFDIEQLVGELLTLPDPGEAPVWHQGMTAWMSAGQLPEIRAQLPPPMPASPPATTRGQAGSARAATGAAPANPAASDTRISGRTVPVTLPQLRQAVELGFAFADLVGQGQPGRRLSLLPTSPQEIELALTRVYAALNDPNGREAIGLVVPQYTALLEPGGADLVLGTLSTLPEFHSDADHAIVTKVFAAFDRHKAAGSPGGPMPPELAAPAGQLESAIMARFCAITGQDGRRNSEIRQRVRSYKWTPIVLPGATTAGGHAQQATGSGGCLVVLAALGAAVAGAASLLH